MAANAVVTPRVESTDHVPFTVIDEAILVLDTPTEPWTIQMEVRFDGHLDEQRLRSALRKAVADHPMARARQLPAKRSDRTWTWEIVPDLDVDPVRAVTCPDDAALAVLRDQLYSRQVPLVESPPFRLVLARQEAGDTLLLSAHHAAFDGFGCLRLLQSVGRRYADQLDPEPAVDLAEAREVERHLTAPDARTRAGRFRMLAGTVGDLFRKPSRLAEEGGVDAPGYGLHVLALDAQQTSRLAQAENTMNDLLVAALMCTIEGWNTEHGATTGKVSLLVPVNLRPKGWREDVVTNMVLETRIVTNAADREDRRKLLETVSAQAERIKKGAGAALVEVLGSWRSMPVWSKSPLTTVLQLTGNRVVDTAVITNLGQLSKPPGFGPEGGAIEDVWFSAPARMPCGLSVGAISVGGRLHLAFRYRPPQFGPRAARRFAGCYLAHLERLVECPTPPSDG